MSRKELTTPIRTEDDPRWAAVLHRDAAADGKFFYSVASTGVYCRPSCAARRPRPEYVRFHNTPEDAERAGFRPCKRCHPDEITPASRNAHKIADVCRFIEQSEEAPSLKQLAERAGLSAYHFHRLFKGATGVTPAQYAAAQRANRVRSELRSGRTVTEAIYSAGYNSNGRFYADSGAMLGMTPSSFCAGGASVRIRFTTGECSLGVILVAASDRGICAISLGDDPEVLARQLREHFPRAELISGDAEFTRLVSKVVNLVETPAAALELPLDIRGTAFQRRVWRALRKIPAGATASYAEIARSIGAPKSVRAVAHACASNVLAVAVPCHRALRGDGALAGYRWGLPRKKALLERERRPALSANLRE